MVIIGLTLFRKLESERTEDLLRMTEEVKMIYRAIVIILDKDLESRDLIPKRVGVPELIID